MYLPFFIARRYLFAKKSHNVINMISIISAVGIAIGTMALIVILSVYNGFDSIIRSFYEEHRPAFVIEPARGKQIIVNEPLSDFLASVEGGYHIAYVVEEDVFVKYGDKQSLAHIRGVDTSYASYCGLDKKIVEGSFALRLGQMQQAVVGRELAAELRLRPRFVTPLELYFPDRKSEISPALLSGPMGSMLALNAINEIAVYPSGIISVDKEFDAQALFLPIEAARELLSYSEEEVSSIELFPLEKGLKREDRATESSLRAQLGDSYLLKNSYQQNETLYKLMKSEKFAVYLILFFVILLISVNIFSSLSMLILEKQDDMETYRAMGLSECNIARVFLLQGWMLSLFGALVGTVVGLILSYIQKYTGIISMPGNYIVSSYPVEVQFSDVMITFTGVVLIGYIIAKVPLSRFSVKKMKKS